jgi:hypothetical protein
MYTHIASQKDDTITVLPTTIAANQRTYHALRLLLLLLRLLLLLLGASFLQT